MVLVLVPQHRLAVYPDSHSPAALQDGRTAYAYLLSQGIPASDIVLSGESSGGDFSRGTAATPTANYRTDLPQFPPLSLGPALRKYLPPSISAGHPYLSLSPLGDEFGSSVPRFLQTGGAEVLCDEHVEFAAATPRAERNRVELVEIGDGPLDTFGGGMCGAWFAEEAEDAAERVE
ncbi:hypothetical protein MMC16_000027 [Acarospora aff. strigata]|nr:hypothetical protein [Acarospora aff. strigata]